MIRFQFSAAVILIALLVSAGCKPTSSNSTTGEKSAGQSSEGPGGKVTIQVSGSDTMLNLSQAWAEEYGNRNPQVSVQVRGGGSGVGIADLTKEKVQMANSSRQIKPKETADAKKSTGKQPKEITVGYDALAIYVHPDNPVESLTIEQLAAIYGSEKKAKTWRDIGIDMDGEIVCVSRQNSSGTYAYFKEAVLGEGDYRDDTINQSGSADVVDLVAKTKQAIGYSGMGYKTDAVKAVPIKTKSGEAFAPTLENAMAGKYPISRPLYIYTLGEPEAALKEFIDWILSETGQKILVETGYVPLAKTAPVAETAPAAGAQPAAAAPQAAAPSETASP